ncbi:MAG: GerMN domain-containing protein [Spirochaetales bacterium]|nr:GerMN domain-containing protein [Spirochaetales bacterium]
MSNSEMIMFNKLLIFIDRNRHLLYSIPMRKRDPEEGRQGIPFLMWILLIVVIAGSFLYSLPKIVRNYQESGLAETVSEYRNREFDSTAEETESIQIYFVIPNSITKEFSCEPVAIDLPSPITLNSLIEALIAGPDLPTLSKGYISFVPDTTRLLGSRIVNHAAYIDISSEFINPNNRQITELAICQLINSALSYELVEDVIILIEGEAMESFSIAF